MIRHPAADTRTGTRPRIALLALMLGGLALAACESLPETPRMRVDSNTLAGRVDRPDRSDDESDRVTGGEARTDSARDLRRPFEERFRSSRVPPASAQPPQGDAAVIQPPDPAVTTVDAAVPAMRLPDFIDTVFGEMLQVPYSTGPEIAGRDDIIQLRSSGELPAADFLRLVSTALRDYGIVVAPQDGLYAVLQEASAMDRRPRFIRSRARPSTPGDLRPVVQFVQLEAIDANSMRNLLLEAFPRGSDLRIQQDGQTGALILTGLPDDVSAALDIIVSMDRLAFEDARVINYQPIFWTVEDLTTQLVTILGAEGWQVSTGNRQVLPVHLVPVPFSNTLLAFVKPERAYVRILHWLRELDQPQDKPDEGQIFVYDVRNTDAQVLSETVNAVISGRARRGRDGQGQAGQGQQPAAAQQQDAASEPGSLVVDPQGNRIIFSGSPSAYQRILPLLRRLDQPAPEVLIEVTVAEITLTDDTQYGLEFFASNVGGDGVDFDFGTEGGLGLAGSGLNVGFVSGDVRGALNAFAQNQRVNILSTPRLMARSGGSASIQVGTDVPVITSQRAADQQSGQGSTDVFQQVQFRSTGVLLNIEPIVFSSGRVDLSLTQEVSSAQPNPNAAIASPLISNRSLTTQLTLEDGATAVLGGLIQDQSTVGETGIPLLKDIPWLGNLFKVSSLSNERTELLIVITAYILRGAEDRQRFVDYLVGELNSSIDSGMRLRTRLPARPGAPAEPNEAAEAGEAGDDGAD